MKSIKIAVANTESPVGHTESNFLNMLPLINEASHNGAELICFPELNLTGYSTKDDLRKFALPIPNTYTEKLSNIASDVNITILSGLAERNDNGEIFASHLVFKPDKNLEIYRKVHLAPPEKNLFTESDSIPVFESHGLTFGIQLCYDAHFPALSTFMAHKGVDAIFIPHASPRGSKEDKHKSWMRHLTARAYDNSIYIVACNQSGKNGLGLSFPGISIVIGPSGEPITSNIESYEKLLYAEMTRSDLESVRSHRMKYFLPNDRPDLYFCNKLNMNSE